jgi:hypothetical protein
MFDKLISWNARRALFITSFFIASTLLSAVTNAAEAGSDVVSEDGQHVDAAIVNTVVQDGPPFEAGIDDGGDAEEFPEDKAVEKNGVGAAEDRGGREDTDEDKSDNCLDKEDCDITFIDKTHDFLARKFYEPAAWFDDFFSSELIDEEHRPKTYLRLKNKWIWDEYGNFGYEYNFRTDIRLTKLEKRLNLVITAIGEDVKSIIEPEEITEPDEDAPVLEDGGADNKVNIALRYFLLERFVDRFYIESGVRVAIPPDSFVQATYSFRHPVGNIFIFRFSESLFWTSVEGAGERSKIYFERVFLKRAMLRLANSATYSETSSGFDLDSNLSLSYQLSDRRAVSVYAGVSGITEPVIVYQAYTAGVRYRQVIYRKWISYELEPKVTWPREHPDGHDSIAAFVFHLEFKFDYSG